MKKNKPEKETDRSIASWDESLHVNRGQRPESDEIQNVVRHHRKDLDGHYHDETSEQPELGKEIADESKGTERSTGLTPENVPKRNAA